MKFLQVTKAGLKVARVKNYLKVSGFSFFSYKSIVDECGANERKLADRLMQFLHDKGLKGAPT